MMNLWSLTASSYLPAMASWTASSPYCERGLRCSGDSVFNGRAPMTLAERDHEYKFSRAHGRGSHVHGARGDNLGVRLLLRTISLMGALSLLSVAACSGGSNSKTIRIGVD